MSRSDTVDYTSLDEVIDGDEARKLSIELYKSIMHDKEPIELNIKRAILDNNN